MSAKSQIILGAAVVLVAAVVMEFIPAGVLIWMLFTAVLALIMAVRGRGLSLTLRVIATGSTFYYAYLMCLLGRTMEPFLSAYTFRMALLHFSIFAALPMLALLRGWEGRARVLLCSLTLPVGFICACAVAAFEEFQFVAQHPSGVGPTPRWTVSHHWLSYDSASGQLNGSD
jgi:hypothetical protein